MFDIAPSEFLLVAFVALVVIGPKDLPKAMRVVGYWVGKARGVARQFRSGFDSMVREAELEEMEKRWASENERIMREHPQTGAAADTTQVVHSPETEEHRRDYRSIDEVDDHTSEPVMVEKPVVAPAPTHASPAAEETSVGERGPDPVEAPVAAPAAPHPDDKTGKSDVASS
ncbi:sec-independent protein translocase protein TatB [Sphingomonas sp. BK036]|uniref:Sec-independent protein translocase protein TatB n=1 Tax=Sphingomonas sp. BK036 TaxID=2512122 RepID=UPI00102A907B|nr:Sec-independent protein translocase protein TatB [Sphingomonas sp. BK036]RZT47662.1 sec-independent protein translocase protein TatB [Sphingomonas sp. BK036]